MTIERPVARAALAAAALALLAGCASPAIDANIAAAHAEVTARGGIDFAWLVTDAARAQARADVAQALRQALSADDAVRIALSHDPALQALLFERSADSADATRAARLPNPVFAFERLAGGAPSAIELTRALTVPLLDLLLLPARAARSDAVQRRLRLQLAGDVLRAADGARTAWIDAVAAGQSARYAAQVRDAAEAGGELARRLEAAGNFSALQRAREEAFATAALAELAQAQRSARHAREALVRALGLDANEAAALALPEHLPALPASVPPADLQFALDGRLDLRLARARLDELARAQGLVRVTGTVDALDLGVERRTRSGQAPEHGLTLSLPLPVFDGGDAARAGAAAHYDAALARTAALAVDAASRLRVAAADLRDSHALAAQFRDRLVPLQATIVGENLLRYNGMLASAFDLLADAREQARTVQRAIAAQRDFWLADAAWQAASLGIPDIPNDPTEGLQ